jgi:sulfur-carrier protein
MLACEPELRSSVRVRLRALANAADRGHNQRMTVEVLYFAAIADLVGMRQEHVELPDSTRSVAELLLFLERRHPALVGRLDQVRVARNESFTELEASVAHQDVVALIPPVAGG